MSAARGFDRPLFILPFDHRGCFESGLFGWKVALGSEQVARIVEAKGAIYDGFRATVAAGVPGDRALNRRQARRLRRLSEYLERSARLFMFELLVPAERAELEELGGSQAAYDRARRPKHLGDALIDLQDAGVEPDVWKIEGLDRREDCEEIARRYQRWRDVFENARPGL